MAKINKDIAEKLADLPTEKRLLLFQKLEEQARKAPPTGALIPRQKRGIEPYPLSFAQQRLWFLNQLAPNSTAYNMFNALRLRGPLDINALAQGFQQVVARHESLRTTFQSVDGHPQQVAAPSMEVTLALVDLLGLPPTRQESEARRLAAEEAQRPFDLVRGPLVRCSLLRLASDEHILLLTMHHIISDGWSVGLLFREIILLGQAFAAGQPNPLPELPLQYIDFTVWQREWLQGEVLEAQLNYWKKQLEGAPAALELPITRRPPAVQTNQGLMQAFDCSPQLTKALHALSQQESATLFMTTLTAFQVLLSRYSGQTDIVVGTPHANRNRLQLNSLIACFVNTLVLRTDLSGDPSFRGALQRVRNVVLGAHNHQDLPFEKLVDELHVARDLGRNPLFQVMFIFQNTPRTDVDLQGLTFQPFGNVDINAQFDLTLHLIEIQQGLKGMLIYNSDLFEAESITRMLRHFQILLEGIVADPQRRLSELPLLSPAEQEQILVDWNPTKLAYPQGKCLHELFEAQAAKTPEAVALVFQNRQLTYRELNERANQLAHYLRSQGVGPDVLVGMCIERSIEMVVGLLAILKAGGAYVPLDPGYPRERLSYMLEDARPAVLLTQQHLQALLPATTNGRVPFCLDTGWETLNNFPSHNPRNSTLPGNLAYVIYTSGSTGKPKGSLLQHNNVTRLFNATDAWFEFNEKDVWSLFHSYAFDFSVWEIWGALLYGGKLVIVPYLVSRSPEQFLDLLAQEQVTILNQTPLAFQQLVEADLRQTVAPALALRKVIFGGEALNQAALAPWFERHGYDQPNLVNMYGITETTVHVTYYMLQAGTKYISCIGRPIPDLGIYLLDASLNLVPVGVPGELHVAGDGLARGYLNRPELSAERFIPDPFSRTAGARMYKSGDLARYLPDGNIEYLGRIDQQVKIRGFRIELGEIETMLSQQPGVHEVTVILREDRAGDKRLVAYLVLDPARQTSVNELRSALKTKLPDYMLPSAFVFLEKLPLTPNGKVDRKALPAPDQEHRELESVYAAPTTPAEETLVDIWADVIGVKQPGIHDNFFELGGDSLQIMRVIARANAAGLHLTPQDFFQKPTIAQLATIQPTASNIQTEQGLVTGPLPLIPIVMHSYAYNAPQPWWRAFEALVEVPRALGPAQLREVVQQLVAQHDNLRLRLVKEDHDFRLFIADSEENAFLESNLSGLPLAEQDAAIEAAIEQQWGSLSFSSGPSFRVVFFDLGPERLPRMLILIHHFAMDGYSRGILLADFQSACQQLLGAEAIRLPAKTTSVQHWAQRMYDYVNSDAAKAEVAYWKSLPWADIRPTPVDHPEVTHSPAARLTESLSVEETQVLLKKVPAAYNVQPLDALLTACALTYAHYYTQYPHLKVFSISLLHHGRSLTLDGINLVRTVGNFYSPYPLFFDVDKVLNMGSPGKVIKFVAEQRARVPHDGAAWPWISYYSAEKSVAWQDKIENVVFNYLGQATLDGQNQATMFRNMREPVKAASPVYDLTRITPHSCVPVVEGEQFKITWEYYSALDERATIESLVQKYVEVLRSLISAVGSIK